MSKAAILPTGLNKTYKRTVRAILNATARTLRRSPKRNNDSFPRMLAAVAAASVETTSLPGIRNWPHICAWPSRAARTKTILARKRGDISRFFFISSRLSGGERSGGRRFQSLEEQPKTQDQFEDRHWRIEPIRIDWLGEAWKKEIDESTEDAPA